MESSVPEAAEVRGTLRKQWDGAADGWDKWSEWLDGNAGHISERLVEMAGVEPGSRVLDVAAGYGEPALTAARAAAPEGSVTATDISAEMLEYGRQRAAKAGVDNIEFLESDAASLDFPPKCFDAAISRWGIIFDPEAEAAAGHVRGLLKSGARMAISSWGPPDRTPFLGLPMKTALKELDIPPPPPPASGPLSRPTPEALGGLLEAGGFSDVQVEEAEVTMEWSSPEEFASYVREIAPPINALIDPHPEDVRKATWDAITEAARETAGGGPTTVTNLVLLAAGKA
jgi:ubiquinone/menaquinone biosynthesis C-methylase UbiE